MAAVQSTIPFKSRKKTRIASKSGKDENKDIMNTLQVTKDKALKRRKELRSIEINENDTCSAEKITRRNVSETTEEEQQWNKKRKQMSSSTEEVESSEMWETKDSQNTSATSLTPLGNVDIGAAAEKINMQNHSTLPMKPLTSREKEIEFLDTFLIEHLESEKSASLYVSGQPGTGKTASLTYILQLPKVQEGFKHVYINCTMVKSAASIYSRICKELQLKTSGSTEKACLTAIEKYLTKKHKMILLVLDEIDQLDSKRQSVLYTIFEWPSLADSRVVLIGIANALDLTERTLPRLQARCSLRPSTLHFAPYTKEQIINIFTTELANEDKSNVFSPVALQMLAAKIAAVSGDMRRALDIGRRVIELAKRSKFSDNRSVDAMMQDSTVTVELKQVLQVLNNIYGGSTQIVTNVEDGFPMQQKLILCSLMLMLTKGKNKDVVMGKLYDVYKKVAGARNIAPLDMCEMSGACALLEARGAVRAAGGGAVRARRVRLLWDEAELAAALRDQPLLSAILNDVGCLS